GRTRASVAPARAAACDAGAVLPHEGTDAGPEESRLNLVGAARAQLEPIFLLYDGDALLDPPSRSTDLDVEGTRLWRVPDPGVGPFFADRQLLIADGHHRYETALAYAAEAGTAESARMMVVLVSTADPAFAISATHRRFTGRPDLRELLASRPEEALDLREALAELAAEPFDRSAAVAYAGVARLLRGGPGELDVELVEGFGHEGISYT